MRDLRTLYVSDLDGTLLNSHSELSDMTVGLLNGLLGEGRLLFTVATARTPATVVPLMSRVEATLPFITMAGAACWDNAAMRYESVRALPNTVVGSLLRIFGRFGIHPFVYRRHGNQIQAHHVDCLTPCEERFVRQRISTPFKRFLFSGALEANDPDEAMLLFSMGEYALLQRVEQALRDERPACSFVCYHDIFDPTQGILEIYAEGTTKAAAVQQMARRVKADRVVVFGDNLNDLPMMRVASHSVAVGNAFDEVRRAADEVIGSNDEDAVARWIEADLRGGA